MDFSKFKKTSNALSRTIFFMAFPVFTIFQNISFYFLILFAFAINPLPISKLKIRSLMGVVSIFLILAAIISAICAGIFIGQKNLYIAINVLPNYTYWGALIIFLGNVFFKFTNYENFGKWIFWGVVANVTGRYFFLPILSVIPFHNAGSPNSFAFQLIIFAPIASSYLQNKYKNYFITFLFIGLISLAGILSGSRSASILVFVGSSIAVLLGSLTQIAVLSFLGILASFAIPAIVDSPAVKATILDLNPRTYELLYETENTLQTDRSYLTRLAMIEKGMNIFKEHPITGIGIGNFMSAEYPIDFKFEGAEFIEYQEEHLMHTNAHNSYISFLSEGGILLLIPMVILIFTPTVFFITHYISIPNVHKGLFIGIIFMSIHSWFIAGMVNVMGWFLLGVANAYIINFKSFKLQQTT